MTDEQRDLLAHARRSVGAARVMVETAYYDFAISRAYYAMFYVASALLLLKGLRFSKHSGVIAAFGKEFVRTGLFNADLNRHFIKAQEERSRSDYTPLSPFTSEDAARYIGYAEDFIALGERLLSEKPSPVEEVDDDAE